MSSADLAVGVLQIRRRGPRAQIHPVPHHAVADEAVVGLVAVAQEHACRHLAADPAFGPEDRAAEESAQQPGTGAGVKRTLQAGAVADFDAFVQHDGAVTHIEDHARLDRGVEADHVARIAQHDASFRHRLAWRASEIGAVLRQEPLQSRDEVPGAAQADAVDLGRRATVAGTLPRRARRHDPAHGRALVDQASDARLDGDRGAARRKPGCGHDRRAFHPARGPARRLVQLAEPRRHARPRIAVASCCSAASHRSRIRQIPARSSATGRTPANGAQAGSAASGSSR